MSLSSLRAQLEGLRARYTDEHPDVKAARAQIAALEAELGTVGAQGQRASQVQQLEEARREVKRLRTRREENSRRMGELEAHVEQAPRTEQELANLTRDFQKLNENYLSLLNKRMDAQMASKLEQRWRGEEFRILDPADLPAIPFFPNRPLFLVMGLCAGLALGFAAAFSADFVDHSIRTEKELSELLPFTVFATVPYIDPQREDKLLARFRAALPPDDSPRLTPNDSRAGRRRPAAEDDDRTAHLGLGLDEGSRGGRS